MALKYLEIFENLKPYCLDCLQTAKLAHHQQVTGKDFTLYYPRIKQSFDSYRDYLLTARSQLSFDISETELSESKKLQTFILFPSSKCLEFYISVDDPNLKFPIDRVSHAILETLNFFNDFYTNFPTVRKFDSINTTLLLGYLTISLSRTITTVCESSDEFEINKHIAKQEAAATSFLECIKRIYFITTPDGFKFDSTVTLTGKMGPSIMSAFLDALSFSLRLSTDSTGGLTVDESLAQSAAFMLSSMLRSHLTPEDSPYVFRGIGSILIRAILRCITLNLHHKITVHSVSALEALFVARFSINELDNDPKHTQDVSKITVMIKTLTRLRNHQNSNVRLAFLSFSSAILKKCRTNDSIQPSVSLLIESMMIYVDDEFPAVAAKCREELDELVATITEFQFWDFLRNTLFQFLTQTLPNSLRAPSLEVQKLETVRITIGYLILLGPRCQNVLNLPDAMTSICEQLLLLTQFDSDDENCRALVLDAESSHFSSPRFLNFHSEEIVSGIVRVLNLLASNADPIPLLDFFTANLTAQSKPRADSALFIIRHLILGIPVSSLLGDELEQYLTDLMFEVLHFDDGKLDTFTKMLLIESLSAISEKCVDLTSLSTNFLTFALPRFIMHLSDKSPAVRDTAFIALNIMKKTMGYTTLRQLIVENTDYILNEIDVKVIRAVIGILEREDVLLYLGPVTDDLLDMLDQRYSEGDVAGLEELVECLCGISRKVGEVPKAIDYTEADSQASTVLSTNHESDGEISPEMKEFCDWYRKRKRSKVDTAAVKEAKEFFGFETSPTQDSGVDVDTGEDATTDNGKSMEDEAPKLNPYFALSLKINIHLLSLLSHPSSYVVAQILSTYSSTVTALPMKERDPLIHKIWLYQKPYLLNGDYRVRFQSLNLLRSFVDNAGEFMTRRSKEVLDMVATKIASLMKLNERQRLKVESENDTEIREWISLLAAVMRVVPVRFLKEEKIVKVLKNLDVNVALLKDKKLANLIDSGDGEKSVKEKDRKKNLLEVVSKVDEDWAWVVENRGMEMIPPESFGDEGWSRF